MPEHQRVGQVVWDTMTKAVKFYSDVANKMRATFGTDDCVWASRRRWCWKRAEL